MCLEQSPDEPPLGRETGNRYRSIVGHPAVVETCRGVSPGGQRRLNASERTPWDAAVRHDAVGGIDQDDKGVLRCTRIAARHLDCQAIVRAMRDFDVRLPNGRPMRLRKESMQEGRSGTRLTPRCLGLFLSPRPDLLHDARTDRVSEIGALAGWGDIG